MTRLLTIILLTLTASVFGQEISADTIEVEYTTESPDGQTFVSTELLTVENFGDTNRIYSYFKHGQLLRKFKCSIKDGNFELLSDGQEHNEGFSLINTFKTLLFADSITVFNYEERRIPRNAPTYLFSEKFGLLASGHKRQTLTAWDGNAVHFDISRTSDRSQSKRNENQH